MTGLFIYDIVYTYNNERLKMTANYEIYKTITGMTEEDMQFNEKSQMDCGNCFTAIPNEVLVDAGELFFLGDYDCENCGEPLN